MALSGRVRPIIVHREENVARFRIAQPASAFHVRGLFEDLHPLAIGRVQVHFMSKVIQQEASPTNCS